MVGDVLLLNIFRVINASFFLCSVQPVYLDFHLNVSGGAQGILRVSPFQFLVYIVFFSMIDRVVQSN